MDCPTCGKSLAAERGVCQHHTKVHDEPLPNRTCKGCARGFTIRNPADRTATTAILTPGNTTTTGPTRPKRRPATVVATRFRTIRRPRTERTVRTASRRPTASYLRIQASDRCLPALEATLEVVPSRATDRSYGVCCTLECYGAWLSSNVVGPDTTSGKVGRSTTAKSGGRFDGKPSSATATRASIAGQTGTTSDGIRTYIIASPFGRSTDSRTPTRWITSSPFAEAVIGGPKRGQ